MPHDAVTARVSDSRDVREGGRWSAAQHLKNFAIYLAVRGALWLADRLSPRLLTLTLDGAALVASRCAPALVARATRNLRGLVPVGAEGRAARQSFFIAARTLAATLLLRRPTERADARVSLDDAELETLTRALDEGRGALVVAAHFGCFEHIAALVAERGLAPAVVVRESYDPRLDCLVDRHRSERGIRVLHRGRSRLGVLRALRQGRPVGLLPDLAPRVPSEDVGFLGRAAVRWPVGPSRLALRTGAPLLVATLRPSGTNCQYSLHFERIPSVPEASLSQRTAARLDAAIREAPEHWLCMARELDS